MKLKKTLLNTANQRMNNWTYTLCQKTADGKAAQQQNIDLYQFCFRGKIKTV